MKYKAIGFDYGGVIAGITGAEFEKRISNYLGVDLDFFKTVYFQFNHLLNQDVLSRDEFWEKITEELGVRNKYSGLADFFGTLPNDVINQNILKIADKLRSQGFKVGILSNNISKAAQEWKVNGLADHFDAVFVSADIGFNKPDPKAFEVLTKALGVKPEELIFIDDTPNCFLNAKEIGFTPVLFTNEQLLIEDLCRLGMKI